MADSSLTLRVSGMHCAACVGRVERVLKAQPGVADARVDLLGERAEVTLAETCEADALLAPLDAAGFPAAVLQDTDLLAAFADDAPTNERWGLRIGMSLAIGVVAMALSMPLAHATHSDDPFSVFMAPLDALLMRVIPGLYDAPHGALRWALLLLCVPVLTWAGRHYFQRAWAVVRHGGADMNVLIALGSGTAFAVSAFVTIFAERLAASGVPTTVWFEVVPWVIGLLMVGNVLEARAKRRATDALRSIAALQPATARVLRADGGVSDVPVAAVTRGDRVLVRPGETIPVDGTIEEGDAAIDESMLTGESVPVHRGPGDAVTGGTTNADGALTIRPTRLGADSALARLVRMVSEAQSAKPAVQRLADRVASVFVPIVVGIALLAAAAWWVFGPQPSFALGMHALVTVLIIACPCAMGLAVPAAITVATGAAAKRGMLIRSGAVLETAHRVNTVVFDKTGTLTEGRPRVTTWVPVEGTSDGDIAAALAAAVAVEQRSEHPLAEAIVAWGEANGHAHSVVLQDVQVTPGRGVEGTADGRRVRVGSAAFFDAPGVASLVAKADGADPGGSHSLVALDGKLVGALVLRDTAKPEAADAVAALKARGVHVVMLSGDRRPAAEAVAAGLGIDEVIAEATPDTKTATVTRLRDEGRVVAMVGDGINDAPALAAADLGVAMGTGTDVAAASADVTLMSGDLSALPHVFALSSRTHSVIRQNLFWALAYNAVGIPIAAGALYPAFGLLLSPVFASLAMALSSVSVIGNSLRLARS